MAYIQATSPVHAPSPRRASGAASLPAVPPILSHSDPSYTFSRCRSPRDSPSRLLSPIRLADRRARTPCSASTSPSCCTNPKRRRPHTRGPIRQRHCKLSDCPIARSGTAVFDELPWISMVDQAPVVDPIQPWNIADLSQLPLERFDRPAKTTGPIRSRKSSLRSAPFPTDSLSSSPELSPTLLSDLSLLELPFARSRRLSLGEDRPTTPPPRAPVLPLNVDFRNLMPVALSEVDSADFIWRSNPSS